jgi:hypothetical protein
MLVKSKRSIGRVAALVGVAALAASLVACGPSKPRMWRGAMATTADASLRDPGAPTMAQLQVDLIGLKADEVEAWKAYPVDRYFSGSDDRRQSAQGYTKAFVFSEPGILTIAPNDPIWDVWAKRGVTNLMILASHKNIAFVPGAEPRRKDIPLTTNRWKVRQIDVVVRSGGIEIPTPMEPLPVEQ